MLKPHLPSFLRSFEAQNGSIASQRRKAKALALSLSSSFQVFRAEWVFLTSTALWSILSDGSWSSSTIFCFEIQTSRSLCHLTSIAANLFTDPNIAADCFVQKGTFWFLWKPTFSGREVVDSSDASV